MANFNLTTQQIKDTYQQLVQVSGSAIVDGTGSLIDSLDYVPNSTFNSFSASISSSVDSKVSTATFVAYTASTSASLSSIETQIAQLEAGSGSASWDLITGKPSGLVSSSAQTIANLPSGTISSSAQVDLGSATGTAANATNATNADNIALSADSTNTNRYIPFTATANGDGTLLTDAGLLYNSFANTLTTTRVIADVTGNLTGNADTATSATTATSASYATNADTLDGLQASAFARLTVDNNFTGTQNFDNISVNGTASIAYLQQVTGSAKIIGDAYIILNNDTPAQRYAGVVVQDSGSTLTTASFEFDGQSNDWFYEYSTDGGVTTDHGVALFGPAYNTKGSHVYPTSNQLQKGTGGHHLTGSLLSDDGSTVSMTGEFDVTGAISASVGFKGNLDGAATTATSASYALTASYALNAAGGGGVTAGLVSGSGTDSMASAAHLTTTAATATGTDTIALGDGADATGNEAIAIGKNSLASALDSIAIGPDSQTNGSANAVAIGWSTNAGGVNAVALGTGAQASSTNTQAIGVSANASGNESVSVGTSANSSGGDSIMIGTRGTAAPDYSIAIGGFAEVTGSGQGGIALGNRSKANHSNGIAIGYQVEVGADNEINIGGIFKYDGTSEITLSGSLVKLADSASQSGSLIDNYHPSIASSSAQIKHIVTIDQTAYTTISGSGNVNDDTLYIISDATSTGVYDGDLQVNGFISASGNLEVGGFINTTGNIEVGGQIYSPTFAGTIASSTSSIDFDNGNFATLNCASSTFLADPTNLKSGTTYTLLVTNGANISGYGTTFKFAGGTQPTLSAGTDVITMVSDGTDLYATALANFS